jgi:hypothetical protein
MDANSFEAVTRLLTLLPSRRDVLHGLTSAGLDLTTLRLTDAAIAKKGHHKKQRKKPKQKPSSPSPSPSPPPSPPSPPFNAFGCLDVGQPCQGDSTLCCSGICEPGTSTCIAHDSSFCFEDTDTCTLGRRIPCSVSNSHCACLLTTGNAGFCADFDVPDPASICRFCSQDTDCQEEFGAGAACVLLRGFCSPTCVSTGRTACLRPCN